MFVRKLVQSGLASFTVALPKEWIVKHKLNKGDHIHLFETKDGGLEITATYKQQPKQEEHLTIQVDKKDARALRTDIIAGYLNGYQQVVLTGQKIPQHANLIKETAASLVGMELIEEDSHKLVLRNFVHLHEAVPDQMVRRIDNVIRSMIIDVKQVSTAPELIEAIRDRDVSVNRFSFLLFKVVKAAFTDAAIATELHLKPLDALFLWEMALHLEKIGDGVKRAARNIPSLSKNGKMNPEALRIWEEFHNLYEKAMVSFYQSDASTADLVTNGREALVKACTTFAEKTNTVPAAEFAGKVRAMLSHVVDITRFARYTR